MAGVSRILRCRQGNNGGVVGVDEGRERGPFPDAQHVDGGALDSASVVNIGVPLFWLVQARPAAASCGLGACLLVGSIGQGRASFHFSAVRNLPLSAHRLETPDR